MRLELVDAAAADVADIAALLSEYPQEVDWTSVARQDAEDLQAAGEMVENGWVRVARIDGAFAGFIAREDGLIHALYTVPDARGSGVGGALLREAQEICAELVLWTPVPNVAAARFYQRAGFAVTHVGPQSDNELGVLELWLRWQAPQGEQ